MRALSYKKLKNNAVKCQICSHYCFIAPNKRGVCGVKENKGGNLIAVNYGKVISSHIDPIEKKPLFHFLPTSLSYSIATVGCNFRCLFCQNADISQASKQGLFFNSPVIPGKDIEPEEVVKSAMASGCKSIAYTYTEPTIFVEFALAVMKIARKKGLKNVWVSNGYMSPETRSAILPYLDAINIDLKSFNNEFYRRICGAQLEPILDNLIFFHQNKVWLEVTTLIIPQHNDSSEELKKIANFIKNKLSSATPWHVTAFYPAFKMSDHSPTPPSTLQRAYQIGKDVGLKYVYTGNIPGLEGENTYCPVCQAVVVKRLAFFSQIYFKEENKKAFCHNCGSGLDFILS